MWFQETSTKLYSSQHFTTKKTYMSFFPPKNPRLQADFKEITGNCPLSVLPSSFSQTSPPYVVVVFQRFVKRSKKRVQCVILGDELNSWGSHVMFTLGEWCRKWWFGGKYVKKIPWKSLGWFEWCAAFGFLLMFICWKWWGWICRLKLKVTSHEMCPVIRWLLD